MGRVQGGALALLTLLAPAPARAGGWDRYEVILWHSQSASAAQLAEARRLGATAGLVFGVREAMTEAALAAELGRQAAPLRAAGLLPYVENIATDFYSAYHRWRPDRPVTFAFDQVQARHQADRADPSVSMREPSLSDPAWRARIGARLAAHARALGAGGPLYFSLGDEAGIADLTAAWDFDFSPASLAGFRDWLRGEYGSLAALNQEWGTGFADWAAVVPLTTDAALRLSDGNFSAWADFKAWMDTAFARALRAGTDALHEAAPAARAGLEGAQVPGTGGYDYTKLSTAVDVLEVTGGEPAFDVAHALNPALVLLTTIGRADAAARHALWRALLAGGRGVVLWDPDAQFSRPDGTPGPNGQALAPLFAEFRGPLGATLIAARPHPDPVAILYSPASFRTRWLLDRQAGAARGEDFSLRRSETELQDNALRRATRQATAALSHLGLEPRWLSPDLLAGGALRQGVRALVLPHALALSDAECAEVRVFIAAGGSVFADVPPGGYDAHSRRRAAPLTEGVTLLPDFARAELGARLAAAGVAPGFALARPDGTPVADVATRVLRQGATTMWGLQRDAADDAAPETLLLTLPQPRHIRDLRAGTETTTDRLTLRLDPIAPTILAVEEQEKRVIRR
jgi:Beta-galactosidase